MKDNNYLFPTITFIFVLGLYILTLNPTVTFTDNGELAGAAYSLGVGHPSGYPLFTLLGYFWLKIPLPWTPIYQLNILSAILSASASMVFYFIVYNFLNNLDFVNKKLNKKSKKNEQNTYSIDSSNSVLKDTLYIKLISLVSSLTLGTSTLVWEQSTAYEVYSLQFLLINLSLLFFIIGTTNSEKEKRYLVLSALFIGFSFSNHLTTILIIPSILYLYLKRPGKVLQFNKENLKSLLFLTLWVLLGISLYIYLPLRSMSEPEFNWGFVHRGLDKFLYHVQGKQYQVWMFSGSEVILENLGKFFGKLPNNLGIVGIILVFTGIFRLSKSYKEILIFTLILFFSCLFYAMNYSIHDIDVYFYISLISLIMIVSAGALFIAEKNQKFIYLIFLLPLINISINYDENDNSDNYLVYDYVRSVVDNVEHNGLIISSQWDYWVSAFYYLQKVENYRTDIKVIDKELLRRTWYPLQLKKWYPELFKKCEPQLKNYLSDLEKFESGADQSQYLGIQNNFESMLSCMIKENVISSSVYVTFDYMNSGPDSNPLKDYFLVPSGFGFRLIEQNESIKVNLDKIFMERFYSYPKDKENHLINGIFQTASMNLVNIGRYAGATGDKIMADSCFRLSLKIIPDNELALKSLLNLNNK